VTYKNSDQFSGLFIKDQNNKEVAETHMKGNNFILDWMKSTY